MKIFNDEIIDFRKALYESQCRECGEKLYWEADFDVDGTNYRATCCRLNYTLSPYQVVVGVEVTQAGEEDEVA